MESEIVWHLCKLEKRFLKKGILLEEYVGIPLPAISVLWRQSKKVKGRVRQSVICLSICWVSHFRRTGVWSVLLRPPKAHGHVSVPCGKPSIKWDCVSMHLGTEIGKS
jgi:hypothetical protein